MKHELKTWPEYFNMIAHRVKTFELRKNDRDFKAGDTLRLKEYDPDKNIYTGREFECVVTYILKDFPGVESGYCIMSFKIVA